MRVIDAKGLVRSNFILLTATSVVSNIKLKDHLENHKQVCTSDKNAVMTMMCMNHQTDLSSSKKDSNQSNTLIIHNSNKRILHYEHLNPPLKKKQPKYITIPSSLIDNAYRSNRQPVTLAQQAVDNANAKFKLQQQQQNQYNLNATNGYQGVAWRLFYT